MYALLVCSLSLAIFPFAAFVVEKLVQQKCISEPVSDLAKCALINLVLEYSLVGCYFKPH